MGKKYFSGLIRNIFRFFNIFRIFVLNIVFWGIIAVMAAAALKGSIVPSIEKETVLVLHLNGRIVEQYSGSYSNEFESSVTGNGELLLRDIRAVIDHAAEDDKITSLLIDLSGFSGGGFSKLQEIGSSLRIFREKGKKIITFAESLKNGSYYIASFSDRIVLDPFGDISIRGFSSYRNYYKLGLDRYGIRMNIFRAGEFKSAVEPYSRTDMSENERKALSAVLNPLWDLYIDDISEARGLDPVKFSDFVNNFHLYFEKEGGDAAKTALNNNIVDSTGDFQNARDFLEEINEIDWKDYLKIVKKGSTKSDNKIAVIVASGVITEGDSPPGAIGAETFEKIIESVNKDESVKGVVLRIDSGGGSASASEKIRRSLLKLKEKGKPFVVSMSSAAASGGYWISAGADTIIASPSTITGSIGVFSVLPDFSVFLEKYPGVTTDSFSTTESPSPYRPDTQLESREKKILSLGVENTYSRFINIVSEARNIDRKAVLDISGGRIWSGIDAVKNRLADRTGFFDDAVKEAALLSGLTDYSLSYYEPEEDWKVVVAKELSSVLALLHYNNFRDFSGKILWPFFYGEGGPYPEKDALKDGEVYSLDFTFRAAEME